MPLCSGSNFRVVSPLWQAAQPLLVTYIELHEHPCLQEECIQRMQTLEGMLFSLSAQCIELGEDLGPLAAEAHPTLQGVR